MVGNSNDVERLERALAEADIRCLLALLVQLTGDRRWIEPPYCPKRVIGMFAPLDGGLDADLQAEVRQAALHAICDHEAGQPLAIPLPDPDLLVDICSAYAGEPVGPEYTTMVLEEMGLASREVNWRRPPDLDRLATFRVAIIGAGLSGLCLAFHLRRLGIPYTVLEKNPSLGGTWYENQYPGCRVDVPNHLYSYSFEPNPGWAENYSRQPQLLDYLKDVATRHGIDRDIRFQTEVRCATWDEGQRRWALDLTTPEGEATLHADVVVSAVGQLNRPKWPTVRGLDDFSGPVIHTAQWDPELDLQGRRIAVIGTGASAMQLVPTIAPDVEHLVVFQRSPQWAAPNRDYHRPVSDDHQWLFGRVPLYRSWYRFGLLWRLGDGLLPVLRVDPDWPDLDRSINAHNEYVREALSDYITKQLAGRDDLLAKALPDYPPYSKRLLIDNRWFATIRRPNVELVVDAIDHVEPDAVVTAYGTRHAVDAIICATGFHASRMLWPMTVHGCSGRTLAEVWDDDDPRAFLGIAMPDFPNLFCLYGPSTNLGHGGSIFFQAECQTRYITSCLRELLERGHAAMVCREESHDDYNERLDAAVEQMVWAQADVDSWYLNSKRRVVANSPWRLVDYWSMTRNIAAGDWTYESSRP